MSTKIEQLKSDIDKLEKGLKSPATPDKFKSDLNKILNEKKKELANAALVQPVVKPTTPVIPPVKQPLKVDELIGTVKPPIVPQKPVTPVTPITPSVPVTPLVPATPSVSVEETTSKKNTNLILLGLGGLAVIYFLFLRKK